ncbi:hypothetical protein CC78DRAFT_566212 [Lojkania enalia]|uniref:Uncharacterized protein n=1 Tax=Lojkania enalia TaxID=147567 RepID=A0A9P4N7V7_9PLEO|nr:hypothetical protein CC78DRAFT_566212 [Didymosphaeria enalia]
MALLRRVLINIRHPKRILKRGKENKQLGAAPLNPNHDEEVEETVISNGASHLISRNFPSSVQPLNGGCCLFRLPAELLSIIYEYVLTEEKGLFSLCKIPLDNSTWPEQYTQLSSSPHWLIESNMLKYVCRQLYHDTRGLGIRFNKVEFSNRWTYPAYMQFLDFFKMCSPANQQRLCVVITDKDNCIASPRPATQYRGMITEDMLNSIHGMIEFCQEHPKVQVLYRTNLLQFSYQMAITGPALARAFRGIDIHDYRHFGPIIKNEINNIATRLQRGRDADCLDTPNFRFWPMLESWDLETCTVGLRYFLENHGAYPPDWVVHEVAATLALWCYWGL